MKYLATKDQWVAIAVCANINKNYKHSKKTRRTEITDYSPWFAVPVTRQDEKHALGVQLIDYNGLLKYMPKVDNE